MNCTLQYETERKRTTRSHLFTSTHWSANYFSIPPTVSNPGTLYTTTFGYDADGNLTGTMMGATSTTYGYDYNNRMISSSGTGKDSISYTYDPAGNRLAQVDNGITTVYPSRFYSVAFSTNGTTTIGTSTEYVYAGDTLLATIDQAMTNGIPVGTSTVHFVHTDNLGSTQATTDMNGNLVQSFDYAPYGSVLAQTGSGIKKQFIDQYLDNSGLNYLNARYLNSVQGQFLSQDPMFLGDPKGQNLQDPQSLNSYSYSDDNPITKSDPTGRYTPLLMVGGAAFVASVTWDMGSDIISNFRNSSVPWYEKLTPQDPNAPLRYAKDAYTNAAIAMVATGAELAVAPAVAGKIITTGGAKVIGATAGGVTNAVDAWLTGNADDPKTGKLSETALFANFASGFFGTRIGQEIPNPRGAPPISFAGSLAGARASTEQLRAELGQLVQALTNLVASYQTPATNTKKQ